MAAENLHVSMEHNFMVEASTAEISRLATVRQQPRYFSLRKESV